MRVSLIVVIAACLSVAPSVWAAEEGADWQPPQVERLVKLPVHYMEKTLDRELAKSSLGQSLEQADRGLADRTQALKDLQADLEQADGSTRIELQEQFLEEKKSMLEQMSQRISLRRREVEIRLNLYRDMRDALLTESGREGDLTGLAQQQAEARSRFTTDSAEAQQVFLDRVGTSESRYARTYDKNRVAIEKLSRRIAAHTMSLGAEDLSGLTRAEQVDRFLADEQARLALLDQEEQMVVLMSRLVSLDAMALSEETLDRTEAGASRQGDTALTVLTDIFVEGEE